MVTDRKKKVLFLCTGNSCRSQMAEGWTRHLWGKLVEPYSAGVEVHGLNRYAILVMQEAGVDITSQYSKHVNELKDFEFDLMITLCDSARERCPYFPSRVKKLHHSFEDPYNAIGSEEEIISVYRRVRDQIKNFIQILPELFQK
ncbi:arsenate reductase ArsC [bacterium]|nr:arsenate reductase ArsC [bacterium]